MGESDFRIIAFVVWVASAFWPASVARRRGHSGLLFFVFSLIFFPAAIVAAYLVPDQRVKPSRSTNPVRIFSILRDQG